ncbi:5-formyltetrahydrofolate cyclo-ligase [Fodinibius halophilus]|uniref:5-formyltetrahydrofolate cyclo-ligase n=1 Tax=Fodinibius halophilus TaxID=1736908 RepID=A0A6M1T2W8_9BACT|nr:5-formyltetrahydrofolate cyclo-ligase [Fodinibius halophilus]NGP86953.1 5-formyltetrahydrofolate cyclo-ligase [Fodinibius halophilus]
MDDTQSKKEKLRSTLLEARESISDEDFLGGSTEIVEKLRSHSVFLEADVIHCYVSMNSRGEVDTQRLIKKMLKGDKDVVVPVTNFKDHTLSHIRLHSFSQLKKNKWGVLEPEEGKKVSVDAIELVVVPMVGGDESANRIGYGEGFYDRFLNAVSCPKVGLCFEQNIVPEIPVEEFDIPLDHIITEERIISRD